MTRMRKILTKFFCFYSNDEYRELATACSNSFARHNVCVLVVELENKNKWMLNCMSRAAALVKEAERWSLDPVCLLDADLTCYQRPSKLIDFTGDIAVHDLYATHGAGKLAPNYRYSAGVCCFGATAHGRTCLKRWAELCQEDKMKGEILREQVYLHQAIHEGIVKGLKVTNIGEEYNCPVASGTVILHHVESRRSRDKIGGGW